MTKLALHWQILIALFLAGLAGWAVNVAGAGDPMAPDLFGVPFLAIFNYVGEMFLNALKMIIVPLILSSIIVGMAGIGSSGNLGALGGRTLFFYMATGVAAILLGLVLINLVSPGVADGEPVGDLLALDVSAAQVAEQVGDRDAGDVADLFLRMIPDNVVMAAAEGQMLGLIFFALLFGYFMTRVGHELADILYKFWDGVFNVMMRMTEWIMKFAPIGVFGLVAAVVAETGFAAAQPLVIFALTVLAGLLAHTFITMPLFLSVFGRVNPWKIYPAMAPAMLTAFSTASSSATLPVTMECVEKNAGVSNKISSFVLPLGATVNMNGTALYECCAAIFLAQAYGLHLSFGVQFSIVFMALLTSIGVAGVPAASLVAIAVILSAIGLPLEALGVLLVFDRVLDMVRTSVNIFGDACCAVIVARMDGEETNLAMRGAA
ncbi:MAG TPA: dicarboxylate/amino acid:cation symporter [Woeseiaceae bacterium]|nr:dicarboxylate/amino acid:cation symporter [Woeseiaceae bacterium]